VGEHETAAALAGQVDELRQLVDSLRVTVTTWEARLERDSGAALMLRLEVKQLREKVAELSATLADALATQKLKDPYAPYWAGQDDVGEAAQLGALRDWVNGFLRVQYPGYQLPDCWAAHREALWELGNLHMEWRRVYRDPRAADLAAALSFHDRWFPGVLARLARSISCDEAGCQLRLYAP
jgi:hypothetical protein